MSEKKPIRRRKFVQVLNKLVGDQIYHESLGAWKEAENLLSRKLLTMLNSGMVCETPI